MSGFRRSGGNAFFAEELLAAVRGRGGNPTLPPSLENVLLSRVQALSEDTQATLRLVAAASGPVEHELLVAVSDLPEPDLLVALAAQSRIRCSFLIRPPRRILPPHAYPGGAVRGPAAGRAGATPRCIRPGTWRASASGRPGPRRESGSACLPLGQGTPAGAGATRRVRSRVAIPDGVRVR